MKQVTLNIPDKDYSFFMKLIKSLKFVQVSDEYNDDFVAHVEKGREDYKNGDFVSVEKENLKGFLGLE